MFNAVTSGLQRLKVGYIVLLTVLLYGSSCSSGDKQPDVSQIKISLQSRRFDRALIQSDTNHLGQALQQLHAQYPDFLDFYLDTLMGFGINGHYDDHDSAVMFGFRSLLTYKDYRALFDTVAAHYPDTKAVEQELAKGFQYLKYYYPKYQVPRITYFISCLGNLGVVNYSGGLGIGLDMFLGEKYPFYASVGLPAYMYVRFTPEAITPSVFAAVYEDFHPSDMEDKNLLELMVEKGKEQYFLQKVIPYVRPEARLGFTAAQLEWCQKNEGMIYNFFLAKNLMYEKERLKVMRYVADGPSATGMPAESPGNVGTWVGWQIVAAYAAKHPEKNLEQILQEPDAVRILQESRYKPK